LAEPLRRVKCGRYRHFPCSFGFPPSFVLADLANASFDSGATHIFLKISRWHRCVRKRSAEAGARPPRDGVSAPGSRRRAVRKNGYYWVEFLKFGAIDAVLFKDGTWRMEDPITDAELRVIGEALPLPTPEEIAQHPERLKQIAELIWTESGADPRWDGIHVDGAYWVRRKKRGPIELARSYEGGWGPYDWSDPPSMWEILPGGKAPPVLFGPLENPGGWNRGSRFFNELVAGEQQRARDVEASLTGLISALTHKFH
jgi:hypothetical protein